MKRYFRFTIALISILIGGLTMIFCSKDDKQTEETYPVVGKWNLSDPTSEFISFEFTDNKYDGYDGDYIILKRRTVISLVANKAEAARLSTFLKPNMKSAALHEMQAAGEYITTVVINGSYRKTGVSGNSFELDLKDFGTITITVTGNGQASITMNGQNYTVGKENEMNSTPGDKTDLLCHKWKIQKIEIIESLVSEEEKKLLIEKYGNDWKAEYEKEINNEVKGETVIIAKTGTFFVYNPNEDGELSKMLHYWRWKDKYAGILEYVHSDEREKMEYRRNITVKISSTNLNMNEKNILSSFIRW